MALFGEGWETICGTLAGVGIAYLILLWGIYERGWWDGLG